MVCLRWYVGKAQNLYDNLSGVEPADKFFHTLNLPKEIMIVITGDNLASHFSP